MENYESNPDLLEGNSKSKLESILSLKRVFSDEGRELSQQELEYNIFNNLVSVAGFDGILKKDEKSTTFKNKFQGTGLLLTTDGYVLTAYHNISTYEEDWNKINEKNPMPEVNTESWEKFMQIKYGIIDKNRNLYPLDITNWYAAPQYDIALIKAIIKEKPSTIIHKISKINPKIGDEIKIFSLRDQIPYNQFGRVTKEYESSLVKFEDKNLKILNTFQTDAYSICGFSGGIFVNMKGEIAGLLVYASKDRNDELGCACGIKASDITNFVRMAADDLMAQFTKTTKI